MEAQTMNESRKILGIYSYVDLLIDSIKELRAKGFEDIRAFSPVPNHEIEDALDRGYEPSKVKYFTFCGALLGACVGAAFTILTSMDWPIVTSAKPIVSIPPYMIIIFECMILIGGLSTFLGLIINSRLRRNVNPIDYDERFSNDKFGLLVTCNNGDFEEVEHILRNFGSEELKVNGEILEEKIPESEPAVEKKPTESVVEEKPTEEKKEGDS
jgi:molybdopterin-containing oxidoreductase family membrane subunit